MSLTNLKVFFDDFMLKENSEEDIECYKEKLLDEEDEESTLSICSNIEEINKGCIFLNTLYKSSLNGLNLLNVGIDFDKNEMIVSENNVEKRETISGPDLHLQLRNEYIKYFLNGYKPVGEPLPEKIKSMTAKKYVKGSTRISFPVYVQPKLNCQKIMFKYKQDFLGNCPFQDEIEIFMAYIPYNCVLDIAIYANNLPHKDVSNLLKLKDYSNITYIICDFYCKLSLSVDERMDVLIKAYTNYTSDYGKSNNFEIIESSIANDIEDIEVYRNSCINHGYSGIVIKKILYLGEKVLYKPDASMNTIFY